MVFFYDLLIMISISTLVSSMEFEQHDGMQCTGSLSGDILRDFVGTIDECKAKCEEIECVGFIRVNSGSVYAGKCYFRGGTLSTPTAYSADDRDCFEVLPDPCLTLDCDDGDSCTTDSCDSSLGCVNEEIDCGSDLVCVDGECVRDCTTFAMDEFLTDCSVGFNANVDDIGVLQTDVEALEARASVGESRLDEIEGDVEDINTRIDGVDTRIDGVDTRIDGVDTRIDTVDESIAAIHIVLEKFDATTEGEAANVLQDDHDMNGDEGIVYKYLSPENKDTLIIFLLVLNMFTMGAGCVTCMKSRGKYKQYESIRNYDTTDVDENRQLQS